MALIWLIAGIVLITAEVLSGDFVLVMLGAAALAGAGAEALFGVPVVSVGVFAAAALGLLAGVRPSLKRRWHGQLTKDNVAGLIGETAVVTTTVDASGGTVRLRGGDWSARALDDRQVLEPGTQVTVVEIQGATAVVYAHGA
ncbi:NfeD family protein [Actinokineospora soli]|uniref:NfeD family protein n=1 Tax=Actinokineospora soli TaxID=1048753 RepID=A0ABW2TRB7_9PSEU